MGRNVPTTHHCCDACGASELDGEGTSIFDFMGDYLCDRCVSYSERDAEQSEESSNEEDRTAMPCTEQMTNNLFDMVTQQAAADVAHSMVVGDAMKRGVELKGKDVTETKPHPVHGLPMETASDKTQVQRCVQCNQHMDVESGGEPCDHGLCHWCASSKLDDILNLIRRAEALPTTEMGEEFKPFTQEEQLALIQTAWYDMRDDRQAQHHGWMVRMHATVKERDRKLHNLNLQLAQVKESRLKFMKETSRLKQGVAYVALDKRIAELEQKLTAANDHIDRLEFRLRDLLHPDPKLVERRARTLNWLKEAAEEEGARLDPEEVYESVLMMLKLPSHDQEMRDVLEENESSKNHK